MSPSLNPLQGWQVDRRDIRSLGVDLQRPECILCEPDGTVWTADARGVMKIDADGTQTLIRQSGIDDGAGDRALDAQSLVLGGSLPNGIAARIQASTHDPAIRRSSDR